VRDRLFNQLKLRYHKQNVCTVRQVIKVLNSQSNVKAIEMDSHHFIDYENMIDKIYNKLEDGTIQQTMCLVSRIMGIRLKWRRERAYI
jgi:hypothetical protein